MPIIGVDLCVISLMETYQFRGGENPFEKGCKMAKKWKIRIPRRKTEYRKLEQKWK